MAASICALRREKFDAVAVRQILLSAYPRPGQPAAYRCDLRVTQLGPHERAGVSFGMLAS